MSGCSLFPRPETFLTHDRENECWEQSTGNWQGRRSNHRKHDLIWASQALQIKGFTAKGGLVVLDYWRANIRIIFHHWRSQRHGGECFSLRTFSRERLQSTRGTARTQTRSNAPGPACSPTQESQRGGFCPSVSGCSGHPLSSIGTAL